MARIKIGGFTAPGFIADRAAHDLPPDAWSEVRNVRFNSKGAEAFSGHTLAFEGEITPYWHKVFPPIEAPIWVYAGLTQAWAFDGTTHTEITNVGADYTAIAAERWQGEVLNGIGVFNNTIDVPQMWTSFSLSVPLANLTNWPGTVRCKFLRPWKFFLFAGYTIEAGSPRPYRLRWSHPAAPGTIPSSWALGDATVDSGEIDIAETEDYLVDGLAMGQQFIVYKQKNVHAVRYVGRPNIFAQDRIVSGRGLLTRDCAHNFQRGQFVAGLDDIYAHTGQKDSEQSLVEGVLRKWVFNQIDDSNFFNCYVVDHAIAGESWFCFPEAGETYPTLALVWNRNKGGIGIRDIPQSKFIAVGPLAIAGSNPIWNA